MPRPKGSKNKPKQSAAEMLHDVYKNIPKAKNIIAGSDPKMSPLGLINSIIKDRNLYLTRKFNTLFLVDYNKRTIEEV